MGRGSSRAHAMPYIGKHGSQPSAHRHRPAPWAPALAVGSEALMSYACRNPSKHWGSQAGVKLLHKYLTFEELNGGALQL